MTKIAMVHPDLGYVEFTVLDNFVNIQGYDGSLIDFETETFHHGVSRLIDDWLPIFVNSGWKFANPADVESPYTLP